MGFLDKFRRRKIKVIEENNMTQKQEETPVQKQPFVADISMFELEKANWAEFAGILKKNRILPNSYIKKPADVKVSLDEKNKPMVLLTFYSSTSDSVREFLFLQDGAFQSVNGKVDDGKNQELIDLWKKFQGEIRFRNQIYTNREGYFHKVRGKQLMKMAEIMLGLENIYELEQNFLEKYKNAIFNDFCYTISYGNEKVPAFVLLASVENGKYLEEEKVTPFSPKTLEFCISKMTKNCKIEQGEYIEDFEAQCKKIKELSCYDVTDWDRVIKNGKDIVKRAYQESFYEEILSETGFEK